MSPESWTDWIAWAGIVLPLMTIAVTAAFHVRNEFEKLRAEQYSKFFELMGQAGGVDVPLASKMAAAYELRKYPQYKDVIIRLMVGTPITGSLSYLLEKEFHLTAVHLGHKGRPAFEETK